MTARVSWGHAGILLGGYAMAVLSGLLIGRGDWFIPAGLAVVTAVALISLRGGRFPLILLTLAVLLQFPLGTIGPIVDVQVIEAVVPLLLFAMVLGLGLGVRRRAVPTSRSARDATRIVNGAIGIYAAVIALNYLRSKFVMETPVSVTRPFYAYLVGLGTYLLVYRGLARERVSFKTVLDLFFWISAAMCLVGLTAVILNLPLDLGSLRYSVTGYAETSAVRVGFLEIFGMAGLALVVVGVAPYRIPAGILFATAVIASGGRSAAIGVALGIVAYLIVTRRRLPLVAGAAVLLTTVLFALPLLEKQAQFERLTNVDQQAFTADNRALFYEESIEQFKQHPLDGTGMGAPAAVFAKDPEVAQFQEEQLQFGGHATYHSLLKNFGLLGFLPFVVALLVAIVALGRQARGHAPSGFFFILLVAQLVALYPAGNGSDPMLFFLLGGGAAALARAGPTTAADAPPPLDGANRAEPPRNGGGPSSRSRTNGGHAPLPAAAIRTR